MDEWGAGAALDPWLSPAVRRDLEERLWRPIGEQATLACEPRDETPASPRRQTPDGHGEKVNLPLLTHEVRPNYTLETMSDRVGGTARLEAMVLQDGTVGRACVRRGLHPDLDVQAVAAAREWRFKPGTRNSEPVPVLVTIDMAFQP